MPPVEPIETDYCAEKWKKYFASKGDDRIKLNTATFVRVCSLCYNRDGDAKYGGRCYQCFKRLTPEQKRAKACEKTRRRRARLKELK